MTDSDKYQFETSFTEKLEKEKKRVHASRNFRKGFYVILLLLAVFIAFITAGDIIEYYSIMGGLSAKGIVTDKKHPGDVYIITYEFSHQGTTYTGKSTVRRTEYASIKEGDPITVYLKANAPEKNLTNLARNPFASHIIEFLAIIGLTLFSLLNLRSLSRELSRAHREMQFLQSLVQADTNASPRAAIDALEREGEKGLAMLRFVWSRHLSPRETLHFKTTIPFVVMKWIQDQPAPVDFDAALKRIAYAFRLIYGEGSDGTGELVMTVPEKIARKRGEIFDNVGLLMLKLLCAGEGESPFKVLSVKVVLAGIDRDEIVRRKEQAARVEEKVSRRFFISGKQRNRAVQQALRESGYKEQGEKIHPVTLKTEKEETEALKITPEHAVMFVNSMLYFFYFCPWRWKPVERETTLLCENGTEHTIYFTFIPGKEMRLEKLDVD